MTQPTRSFEHLTPDILDPFIDGELSPGVQQGIEEHLATCHACTLRVLSATKLKSATARAGHRFAPSPEALARITAQFDPQLQSKPKERASLFSMRSFGPAVWTALAATVLLIASLLGWRRFHQANTLAAELLDQHLATLSSAATPQVISTDRHTVKPWFQGRLPFSFNLPDASALPPDTTLRGADLVYLGGQPAALLLFTIHKHEVSIFLTQRSTSPMPAVLPTTRAGFAIHTSATPDLSIVAVSDVNPVELESLLTSLMNAQAHQ